MTCYRSSDNTSIACWRVNMSHQCGVHSTRFHLTRISRARRPLLGCGRHGDKVNGSSSTCMPPLCASPAIQFTCGPHLLIRKEVLEANPGCLGPPPPPPPCPAAQFCPLLGPAGVGGGSCATANVSYPPVMHHYTAIANATACEAR